MHIALQFTKRYDARTQTLASGALGWVSFTPEPSRVASLSRPIAPNAPIKRGVGLDATRDASRVKLCRLPGLNSKRRVSAPAGVLVDACVDCFRKQQAGGPADPGHSDRELSR